MFTAPIGLLNPNVGGGYPAIIDDGNTMMWVDYLENITKDGGGLVSIWGDKSGNGNDLLQAVGTNQPLWSANGILFDGVNDYMKAVAFTLNQPEQIYIVFKQITWVNSRYIFDGDSIISGDLGQASVVNGVICSAGTNSTPIVFALDTYGIFRVLFNGASSKLILNEGTPVTGNFGSNNMGGFILGALGHIDLYSNIEVKEIIIRKIADSSGDEQDIYDYLAAKYSI